MRAEDRIEELEAELALARRRLSELDHRIKNDLQLIGSVFILQLRRLGEGPQRTCIRAMQERVNAVATVHRRLNAGDDPARYEASGLVREVAEDVASAERRDDVRLAFDLAPVRLPSRQAGPLALIVGELVRNAIRHAFPERKGRVEVAFGPVDGMIRLEVRDDGVGFGADRTPGFGTTLAGLLAQQLRGTLETSAADPGVRAVVRFPAAD